MIRHVRLGGPSTTAALRRRIGGGGDGGILELSEEEDEGEDEGGIEGEKDSSGMVIAPWAWVCSKMRTGMSWDIFDVSGWEEEGTVGTVGTSRLMRTCMISRLEKKHQISEAPVPAGGSGVGGDDDDDDDIRRSGSAAVKTPRSQGWRFAGPAMTHLTCLGPLTISAVARGYKDGLEVASLSSMLVTSLLRFSSSSLILPSLLLLLALESLSSPLSLSSSLRSSLLLPPLPPPSPPFLIFLRPPRNRDPNRKMRKRSLFLLRPLALLGLMLPFPLLPSLSKVVRRS